MVDLFWGEEESIASRLQFLWFAAPVMRSVDDAASGPGSEGAAEWLVRSEKKHQSREVWEESVSSPVITAIAAQEPRPHSAVDIRLVEPSAGTPSQPKCVRSRTTVIN